MEIRFYEGFCMTTFAPLAPTISVPPLKVADETFVIHQVQPALGQPLFVYPIDKCRWVMHDESFDIGDRTLHAIRPPVFDSPTTRGLFDPSTGVYWCVDSFATPLPDPNMGIADLDPDFWRFGMTLFSFGAVSPWLTMVDYDKFGQSVDRVQGLDMTTIAGCHTPVLEGPLIQQALDTTREFPSLTPPPLPDQSILDQIIAALSQPVS